MLKPGRVWQEETFKIEKSRGCQDSFFVFSIFLCFLAKRKPWVLTIYTEKPEIPVGKSNGTSSSVRNVPEKVGGRLR